MQGYPKVVIKTGCTVSRSLNHESCGRVQNHGITHYVTSIKYPDQGQVAKGLECSKVAGQNHFTIFMRSKSIFQNCITAGVESQEQGMKGRGSSVLKIEMLIKHPRSRCQRL